MSAKGMLQSLRQKPYVQGVLAPGFARWAKTHHGNKRRVLAVLKAKARRQVRHAADAECRREART